MPIYRNCLPQLDAGIFLTDGGIETTLIFEDGLDLPDFAAFHLLKDAAGRDALCRYFYRHASIAKAHDVGFILESATWRASADWGVRLGYNESSLAEANRHAIKLLVELREELATASFPMVISGCVGPRGDGYDPGALMSTAEAEFYHRQQISVFADTEADMVTAITMTNVNEAIGLARAADSLAIPHVISFTVETDGRLPTGQSLMEAIEETDAKTGAAPAYYMVNCAHPAHFDQVLLGGAWIDRLRGLRANASTCSHTELDEAETLDEGDPVDLGQRYAALRARFPRINILGGCCGNDHRHIKQIALACISGGTGFEQE